MKLLALLMFLLSTQLAFSKGEHHIPLDLNFDEYRQWYKNLNNTKSFLNKYEPYVKESIDSGEKMSNWIKLINKTRTDETAIRLTNKNLRRGIPIDKPSIYGPSTIAKDYQSLKQEIPDLLKQIIFGQKPITKTLPVSDEVFIQWGRKVSKLYQTAVRWTGLKRWIPHLSNRKKKDVRGYYYLKSIKNIDDKLDNFSQVETEQKNKIIESLIQICVNSISNTHLCPKEVAKAKYREQLRLLKNRYWAGAKKNWDSFFTITKPRKDVEWSGKNPNLMNVTFKDPRNQTIAAWLKDNIEDEFRRPLKNWELQMNFVTPRVGATTAYLEFQPNVTPHVTGGNKIVMDANTELEEYSVKWTIRHEYGHILRIPDCYLEFYEKKDNVMINYQLDTSDLMCSRAGDMNDRIYEELKRNYFKK